MQTEIKIRLTPQDVEEAIREYVKKHNGKKVVHIAKLVVAEYDNDGWRREHPSHVWGDCLCTLEGEI